MKLYDPCFVLFVFLNGLGCCPTETCQLTENEKKLLKASKDGDPVAVKNLLKKNCNINIRSKDKKQTPLMLAVYYGHSDVLKALFEYNNRHNVIASTLRYKWKIPENLIQNEFIPYLDNTEKLEVDLQDKKGNTALMLALCHLLSSAKQWHLHLFPSSCFACSYYPLLKCREQEKKNNQKLIYSLLKVGTHNCIKNNQNRSFEDLLSPQEDESIHVRILKHTIAKTSNNIVQEKYDNITSILRDSWNIPEDVTKNILCPYLQKINKQKHFPSKSKNENSFCFIS